MKTLQFDRACTYLKLTENGNASSPLAEQLSPYLRHSPQLILDVAGIHFNSMHIGEMVNLHRRFEEVWKDRAHRIGLVHVTPTAKEVLTRVRLVDYLPIYDSLDDAIAQIL